MRRCAVLGNGVIGAEKQALALAEAVGLQHTLHRILPPRATRWLPTAGQLATDLLPAWSGLRTPRLGPPHPALAISCGRASIPASIALRADSGGRTLTVHVQRPPCAATHFDLVIAPAHDYAGETPPSNVLLTDGSLHDVCDATLRTARGEWEPRLRGLPRPRLAVLLGGAMRRRWWQRPLAPELTVPRGRQLLREAVAAVAPLRGSVMLAASRRTPPEVAAAATREMEDAGAAAGVASMAWAADASPSPYAGLLGCSDYLLVSADSVNMTSEAIGTAKPVYVAGGGECARRLGHFHALAAAGRRTRPWAGALEPAELWAAPPASEPTDVQRAAARVLDLLQARESIR